MRKFIFLIPIFILLSFIVNSQTTLLSDPGTSYTGTDSQTSDDYGTVDISNCSSVRFSVPYDFSLPWDGFGNMESADECPGCNGDPDNANALCNNCWDYFRTRFMIDGGVVNDVLIGGSGTSDAEQSGTINYTHCTNGNNSTASINIQTITWANNETITFGPITIVCYEGLPNPTANPDPVCEGGVATLDAGVTDPGVVNSSSWTGPGTIIDPSSLTTDIEGFTQPSAIYTISITDANNCVTTEDIELTVTSGPMAFDAGPLYGCLRIDGTGLFDLTQANNTVNGGTGLPVNYFEDAAGTIPIGTPTAFTYNFGTPPGFPIILPSLTGQVYAQINDNGCLSNISTVTLEAQVGDATVLTPNPLLICIDPDTREGDVDLDPYNSQIVVAGGRVDWYGWEGLPNLPFFIGTGGLYSLEPPATLYGVYIDGDNCIYIPSTFDVEAHPIPMANDPTSLRECADENGEAIFDLTQHNNEIAPGGNILWFEDMSLATSIADPTSHSVFNSTDVITTRTVYAVNQDPVTGCNSKIVTMELIIDPFPMGTPVGPFTECSVPGTTSIVVDLTAHDLQIAGVNGTVVWYSDDARTMEILTPTTYSFMVPGATVYAQVVGPAPSNCLGPLIEVQYTVDLSPFAMTPPDAEICVIPGATFVIIDLTQYQEDIYSGLGIIKWYTDIGATNEILNPESYSATIPLMEVYARVEDNGCLSNIVTLKFVELMSPVANDTSIDACDDGGGFATFDLTSINSKVNGNSGNPVIYYEDYDGTDLSSAIGSPASYYTDRTTIWAQVTNGKCESRVAIITLNILSNVELIDISPISVCADENGQAKLNLPLYDPAVLDGEPGTIIWYLENGITEVLDPSNVTITGDTSFIAIAGVGTTCESEPVVISFELSNGLNYTNPNNPYYLCPDPITGLALIDLDGFIDSIYTGAGIPIWRKTNGDTIDSSVDYYGMIPHFLYLSISEGLCQTDTLIRFIFQAQSALNLSNTTLTACDDGNSNGTFNLTSAENAIFNNPNAIFTYFEDAALTLPIGNPSSYIGPHQSRVYVSVSLNGCDGGSVEVILLIETCSCLTKAAELRISSINICIPNPALVDTIQATMVLEPGDDWLYVLHDGTSTTLGTILDQNITGVFNYNNYVIGKTYYIHVIAGPVVQGNIDFADSCFDKSDIGVPVKFFLETELSITKTDYSICPGDSLNLELFFNIPDQTYSYDIVDLITGASRTLTSVVSGNIHSITLFPTQSTTLEIRNIKNVDVDCNNEDLVITINIKVLDPISASLLSATCVDNNDFYVVEILLRGGQTAADYILAGTSTHGGMFINDSVFVSIQIPTGTQSIFSFNGLCTDNSNVIVPAPNCACVTNAGLITLDVVEACSDDVMNISEQGNILDNDDLVFFIIHDQIDLFSSTFNITQTDRVIRHDTRLTIGQTYYVTMVVGNGDANGTFDISDPCLDISNTLPFVFLPSIEVNITPVKDSYCLGDSLAIIFDFEGATNLDLEITNPEGQTINLANISDGQTVNFYSTTSGVWRVMNVTGILQCIDLGQGKTILISDLSAQLVASTDYDGYEISCGGLNDGGARIQASNGSEPYMYLWSDGNTSFERNDLLAGLHSITVVDAGGCIDSSTVMLTEPLPIVLSASADNPDCFGNDDGAIIIENVSGGSGQGYQVAVNGFVIDTLDVNNLPHILDGLGADTYEIGIFDSNNCYNAVDITLISPTARLININRPALAGDSILNLGQSIQLEVQSVFSFDSIEWITDFEYECLNPPVCSIIRLVPQATGEVMVIAIDEDGCISEATTLVLVNTERKIYAPGAFSPNGDINNDLFTIYSNQIDVINKMLIFDRWGNQLFEGLNFPPNLESYGWDGTYKEKKMNPGVYIWTAEILLIDGTVRIVKGDITLVR